MKNIEVLEKHHIKSFLDLAKSFAPNILLDIQSVKKIDKLYELDFLVNYLNISKKDVLEKIKELTGIDYILDFNLLNVDEIRKNIKNIEMLKKYNFFPIIKNSSINSIVTSNPFYLIKNFNVQQNVKIYLALGKDISNFLDTLQSADSLNDSMNDIFYKTLKLLIIEVESKNVTKIVFEKSQNEITYSYQDIDNNWKKGKVLSNDIEDFWYKLNSNYIETVDRDKFFKNRCVSFINISNALILEWNIPKKVKVNRNNLAIVSKDNVFCEKILNDLKIKKIFVKNYETFFDLYNDYQNYEFKATIIHLSKELILKERNMLALINDKSKKILISLGDIESTQGYTLGADYYIDSEFSFDYLYEIINGIY